MARGSAVISIRGCFWVSISGDSSGTASTAYDLPSHLLLELANRSRWDLCDSDLSDHPAAQWKPDDGVLAGGDMACVCPDALFGHRH